MASEQEHSDEMTCEEAALLMDWLDVDDPAVTAERRAAFSRHLLSCAACAAEYEESQEVLQLLREYRECRGPISRDTRQRSVWAGDPAPGNPSGFKPLMSVEEGWQDLLRRCPDLAEAYARDMRQQRIRRMFRRIGQAAAMAACLAILICGWLFVGNKPVKPAAPISPRGYAEIVSDTGRQPLLLGQPITTQDRQQELLLGGMHRVILNRDTTATIGIDAAKSHDGKTAYSIQLAAGEAYAEVVPGNPFTVAAFDARLDITGTTFNVKAQDGRTELTLVKGSVRFSPVGHLEQAVSVTAGHASTITGQSAPTPPKPVDALAVTAWATRVAFANAARPKFQRDVDLSDLNPVRLPASSLDPETLDYANWLGQHNEFFAAYEPLTRSPLLQPFHPDRMDIFIASQDERRLTFDPKRLLNLPPRKLSPESIACVAHCYGADVSQLLREAGIPEAAPLASLPSGQSTLAIAYAQSLEQWQAALLTAKPSDAEDYLNLRFYSLRASQYLSQSRTAVYLWARACPNKAKRLLTDGRYPADIATPSTTSDYGAWLKQLHKQATVARSCEQVAMEWFLVPDGTGCTSQAIEHQRKLAALVAELLPPLEDRMQEGKGGKGR